MVLYKKDSKGKIRFVEIYSNENKVIQKHGIIDGKVVSNESECVGKNIGKLNETSPEEQAILEANAKIVKKLDEGYFKSIEEANNGDVILPMLAKDFKIEEHKVVYPVFVQPKIDGMRCLKNKKVLKSRKNKDITTMGHILKEMCEHEYIFDGELYAHGKNFQENMELIKKYREGESEEVKYHVYDLVIPDLSFKDRYDILEQIINNESLSHIELVPTYLIYNKEELNEIHSVFLKNGYEGTIVRTEDGKYEINKRSSSLLKYKDFKDISCKIIEVIPSEKRPKQGIFICEHRGNSFGCGMKFSHAEREKILINKEHYIGKTAEIRFFEYTEDGIPRFPVAVGIRLDK